MELSRKLTELVRLTPLQLKSLKRLGLETIGDILYYFPTRYSNVSEIKLIRDVAPGDLVILYGKISNLKTRKAFRTKMPMGEAVLEDSSGKIRITWFNQAYMAKMVHEGDTVELTGKIANGKQGLYLSNPELKEKNSLPIDTHDSLFTTDEKENIFGFPIYRETRGVTSRWIYHTVQKIIQSGTLSTISEYLPKDILSKYNLPKLSTALVWIHSPRSENDANAARKRFAFEEVFFIQLARLRERSEYEKNRSYKIESSPEKVAEFTSRFPFTPTSAQKQAISTILSDISKERPMARLLEGDVGSGKTAVAATVSFAGITNRPANQNFGTLQVAYMAPTEILATQHFENFIKYFRHTGIQIGLITGSGCRKFPSKVASAKDNWTQISRAQLLKWVANGEIPILLGTHALIQKSVKFKHLGLVIIDEQHRFGALQRARLAKKEGFAPHFLSMTATPIPRTLALTIYGDLDLTLLDEMPLGRKVVETEIVHDLKRELAYERARRELEAGHQIYVICPRINEPDPEKELALQTKSVTEEAKRLKKEVFSEYEIGILHSKMTKQKKDDVMEQFLNHEIDILVATSVVEVGVNVPNATVIIIEGAERFGLAQLHQLRGRVLRSTDQAYCFLFAEAKSGKTMDRLKALKTAKNGFELAELDLALRGAGELAGTKQWGITDLGMEAIKNIKMVEAARTEAQRITGENETLSKFPLLQEKLSQTKFENLHFE